MRLTVPSVLLWIMPVLGSSVVGARPASAGSSESTGTDTGTGTGTGTGADTGTSTGAGTSTGTDTGTGPATGTSGGTCDCNSGDDSITILEPAPDASVAAPFTVTVEVTPRCPCFDCECGPEDPQYVQLFLDHVVWGGPCNDTTCTWEVTGTIDEHILRASAAYESGLATTSRYVTITSVDAGTSGIDPPDPTTTPADADTGGTGQQPESDDGCGCSATPRTTAPLALLLLPLVRRRRARRPSSFA